MQQITKVNLSKLEDSVKAGEDDRNNKAVAKIPQGYNMNINIRLVPGRDFKLEPDIPKCKPRGRATVPDVKLEVLPADLVAKLKDADKKVVAWLAADDANGQLFIAHPVEALTKAGVDLTRSEQKNLERAHTAVNEARVIAPGVNVKQLSVTTYPKGHIGKLKDQPEKRNDKNDDFGCEPKRKE
jgi:hypothetical protein